MSNIIDPKYRDKRKERDWLASLLDDEAKLESGGTDRERLLTIAEANGGNVSALRRATGSGVEGRIRMSVGNILRAVARKRHGIHVPNDSHGYDWRPAPADWLEAQGAPEEPSHDRDGKKIKAKEAPKGDDSADVAA